MAHAVDPCDVPLVDGPHVDHRGQAVAPRETDSKAAAHRVRTSSATLRWTRMREPVMQNCPAEVVTAAASTGTVASRFASSNTIIGVHQISRTS